MKSDQEWIISTNLISQYLLFQGVKGKQKLKLFSWKLAKAVRYNGEGKAPCIECNHYNKVCQASTLSAEEITKIKQVFLLSSET